MSDYKSSDPTLAITQRAIPQWDIVNKDIRNQVFQIIENFGTPIKLLLGRDHFEPEMNNLLVNYYSMDFGIVIPIEFVNGTTIELLASYPDAEFDKTEGFNV